MKHQMIIWLFALTTIAGAQTPSQPFRPGEMGETSSDSSAQQQRAQIEQLRMRSNQATDLAHNADQSAANEDRLAQTGPNWARLLHQAAAIKFRGDASKFRESAQQFFTQAQEMERQFTETQKRAAPAEPVKASPALASAPSGRDDYLSVTDAPNVENAIQAYLNRNGIKASTVTGNNGAVHFVQVGYTGANGLPSFQYKIMALAPISSGNEPSIQLIAVTLETNVKASSTELLFAALSEANKIGNCAWFLDEGAVKCRSWITIPGPAFPIPADLIRWNIRMINADWLRFSPKVLTASK